jgi:hypothetical protein
MSVARVRVKADRLPKADAGRRRVDRYGPVAINASQECGHQLTADTDAAKGRPNIEPPHAQSTGHNRFDRQSADAGEHTIQARGEQRLAVAIEPCCACFPIRSEPFHLPEPLGERLGPQRVKANWQGFEHRLEFEPIIGRFHNSPALDALLTRWNACQMYGFAVQTGHEDSDCPT